MQISRRGIQLTASSSTTEVERAKKHSEYRAPIAKLLEEDVLAFGQHQLVEILGSHSSHTRQHRFFVEPATFECRCFVLGKDVLVHVASSPVQSGETP
jgi:hypothetical protein